MQTFKGRLVNEQTDGEQTATEKDWTIEEITHATQNGDMGMISLCWYTIGGRQYKASGLTIGGDESGFGIPREQDGKMVVLTHFRRRLLSEPFSGYGDPMDLVAVEVEIDPADIEYVSIVHNVANDVKTQPSVPQPLFIAVFTDGGLITTVKTGRDLRALILYMQHECDERFDPETDDARIFDADGDEVYVVPHPGELKKEDMGVYYCPVCPLSERVKVSPSVFCINCLGDMERLDTLGMNA